MGHLQHIRHMPQASHVLGTRRPSVAGVTTYQADVAALSPFAYWRLGAASGNDLDTVNGWAAVTSGNVTQGGTALLSGNAGTSYFWPTATPGHVIPAVTGTLVLGQAAWTYTALFKRNWATATNKFLFGESDAEAGVAASTEISLNGTTNKLIVSYADDDGAAEVLTSTSTWTNATIYHLAVTLSAGTLTVYRNGTADGSLAVSGVQTVTNGANVFGAGTGLNNKWNGNQQELGFFHAALTGPQILALANKALLGT